MPRAIILTSLPIEYMAVRSHLECLKEEIHPLGTIYERGSFNAENGVWDIGIAEIGTGNSNTSTELERAISHFNPDFLFLVGIAHSIKDAEIGDVVAATKVYGYESGQVSNTFSVRPEIGQSAYQLIQRARAEARKGEWIQRIKEIDRKNIPNAYVQPIAAGNKIVLSASSTIYTFLTQTYNDALAVDMGGIGFLRAAFAHTNKSAIVIRGISKALANEEHLLESERVHQQKAAHNSSAFAFQVLSQLRLPVDINISPVEVQKKTIHNLPSRPYKTLIGRSGNLSKLLHRISSDFHERIITIKGIGGVGKTSLALEAAHKCLVDEHQNQIVNSQFFDVIVFSSARLTTLSPEGIIGSQTDQRPIRTLRDLCADIDNLLSTNGLKVSEPELQTTALQDFLSRGNYRILLILDNLEALQPEDVYTIREFLKKIKGNHIKTIITTRYSDSYDIHVRALSTQQSLKMINNLLKDKNCALEEDFCTRLNEICGGVPLAINYAIGLLELRRDFNQILDTLTNPEEDLCKYCFDKLISVIESQHPTVLKIFLVLSLAKEGLTRENLFAIAGVDDLAQNDAEYALSMLSRCSLVFYANDRHKMLPLTRRYALSRLKSNPRLDMELRKAWVERYLKIAEQHGGEDKGEWHKKYDELDKERITFKEVFTWFKEQGKYEEPRRLWQALSRFAYLYGYWTDRIDWSDWLNEAAYQRADHSFLAELNSAYAWLTLLREGSENLQKAEDRLTSAKNLSKHAEPHIQNTIIINLATLYSRKQDFKKSEQYFKESMRLRSSNRGKIDPFRNARLEIRFLFYYAEDFYRRLEYTKAKKLYNQVIKKSDAIYWLRLKVKTYERLAHIAILEDRLEEAQNLLDTWYPVACRNHDYRRLAFFERDYAKLEFEKQNYQQSKESAIKALGRFQDLKMLIRVEKMENLIEQCNVHID